MKTKYNQFQNKFFIKVPVAKCNKIINYLDCYIYGYINKKITNQKLLSKNLQVNKNKLNLTISKLKELGLIYETNKNFYVNKKNEENFFLFYENNIVFDLTFLPNIEHLTIEQNALYWKLYKYSDPVRGLNNCYTISSKVSIQKMNDEYLMNILGFSKDKIKKSIRALKKLNLIKIKRSKAGFYFGIQPVKEEMQSLWRDNDSWFYSDIFDQKEVLDLYSKSLLITR